MNDRTADPIAPGPRPAAADRASVIARLGIDDGVVVDRRDAAGTPRRVLYYRSPDRLSLDDVQHALGPDTDPTVDAVMKVTAIPYDPDGEVDDRALMALPVPDAHLADAAEQAVRAAGHDGHVVAVVVDAAPPARRIHEYQVREPVR